MRNIKLVLEYDGTNYFGFQRQLGHKTIQAELEKALSKIFSKKMKIKSASGRTDSGCHALGQVVNFYCSSRLGVEKIQKALNALLPEDIVVKKAEEVEENFHARYWAKSKLYRYSLLNSRTPLALNRNFIYHYPYPLNLSLMRRGAKFLIGRHEFSAFAGSRKDGSKKSLFRTIKKLRIIKRVELLEFYIEADGFLYNMVRNIVGTLLWVGRKKLAPEEVKKILKSRDRRLAGPTVPAKGLCLSKVNY